MSSVPPFIFRIDEIRERPNAAKNPDNRADWVPSVAREGIGPVFEGVYGQWWCCNGLTISNIGHDQLPGTMRPFKTYSMFYLGGFGFWVLQGDATRPNTDGHTWQPLRFDHDALDNYSSYLCNVSQHRVVACRHQNQQHWMKMLLPDIYYEGSPETPYVQYGALKGELPIFLGLIAFSMQPSQLFHNLPNMLRDGQWQTYDMPHGRNEHRGVVVHVYTWPPNGSVENLKAYEAGSDKYYR